MIESTWPDAAHAGDLDEEGRARLVESSELCRTHGIRYWIPQIDELAASLPATPLRS